MRESALSVVCLLGSRPERLRRLVAALAAQTAGELEVILVGGPQDAVLPPGLRWRRIDWPPSLSFGEARAVGVREAGGEIVAFLLDHTYPQPDWAEALIDAYGGGWAAVGYGFRNANPGSRASDATYFAHFGPWLSASPGAVPMLPGNNVSYRRRALLDLGPSLGELLEIDASAHRQLLEGGSRFGLEPRAAVEEECFESLRDACGANRDYGRLLASRRVRDEGLSMLKRVLRGLAAPLLAPTIRFARIWSGSAGRRGELVRRAPSVLAISAWWGLGELGGYMLGPGDAAGRLRHWEVEAVRAR